MMLKGDVSATDFDGLVSRIILPQIQSINNMFRQVGASLPTDDAAVAAAVADDDDGRSSNQTTTASHTAVSSARYLKQWASRIQALERRRYDGIVSYQQAVVDHLTHTVSVTEAAAMMERRRCAKAEKRRAKKNKNGPLGACAGADNVVVQQAKEEEGEANSTAEQQSASNHHHAPHHHHCCSHDKRAHTHQCLFYGNGNGSRACALLDEMRRERDMKPKQPVGSSTNMRETEGGGGDGCSVAEGGAVAAGGAVSEKARLVAQQKAFISNLMSNNQQQGNHSSSSETISIPPFLAFGSQKTIPLAFDLSPEYTVPIEWVEAVADIDMAALRMDDPAREQLALKASSSHDVRAANSKPCIVGDSDEEPESSDTPSASDDEDEEAASEDILLRTAASLGCDAFNKKIRCLAALMHNVEEELQDALDEAMEEMQG